MKATTGLGFARDLLCLRRYSAAAEMASQKFQYENTSWLSGFRCPRLTLLLHVTTNLSDDNESFAGVVLHEQLDEVQGGGTRVWVTSDTDADGLSQTDIARLCDGLVGQCSRS